GWAAWQRGAPPVPAREYVTAPGQRLAVSFSDGSRVLLGVASRLRVPRDYGVRTRAVELEGEAYFVVRHDPAHPFLVRTAHGTTEDLGTEFDVRAYRGGRSLERERLTISFTTAAPDEALSALARVLGARFTREERVVRLTSVRPVR